MAERPIHYLHATGPDGLPDLPKSMPHCAIIVSEQSLEPEARFDIAVWLVRAGCTLMMTWGLDGSAWDDAGDWADSDFERPEVDGMDAKMMTTWHDHEKLNEVFDFAMGWQVPHPAQCLNHTLVLHVARHRDESRIMALLMAPLRD